MVSLDVPIQKEAEKYEQQVIDFLDKLGFQDVDGGRNFNIGGIQVDACGGHEDTLLVIECVISRFKSDKSIRQKIQIFRGNMPILSKALHKHEKYGVYKYLKYILAIKNILVNEADAEFALEKPHVSIWDEQFIQYYQNLYSIIGAPARYNLLGEIGVKPRVQSNIQIPAFKSRLGNYTYYSFLIEPQQLIQVSYVARREVGKETYYQRILNKDRIRNIRKFIEKGGIFPNNVIISFNTVPEFTPYSELGAKHLWWPKWLDFGVLTFPSDYRTCWIIDGQHRLYSFPEYLQGKRIAVAAFEKLKPEIQAKFFIEINKEQKPVEADLLWDLEGEMRPNHREGIISNIVKSINNTEPLFDRIRIPLKGGKAGQLKFSGICVSIQKRKLTEKVTETMEGARKNPLFSDNAERMVNNVSKALACFFTVLNTRLSEAEKSEFAITNGGISVMIMLFEKILSRLNKVPTSDDIDKYIKALHKILEEQYPSKAERTTLRARCASEAGKADLARILTLNIRDITGDKQFGGSLPPMEFESNVIKFERSFASFILRVLQVQSINDLRKCAPRELCDRLEKRVQDGELSNYLTLGECLTLIEIPNNWIRFKPLLVETPYGFGTDSDFGTALRAISRLRNDVLHGRLVTLRYKEKDLVTIYVDKLTRCIDDYNTAQEE